MELLYYLLFIIIMSQNLKPNCTTTSRGRGRYDVILSEELLKT